MRTSIKSLVIMLILGVLHLAAFSQDKYFPKGDPKKLQVEVSVHLWLPWIKGEVFPVAPITQM